MRRLAMNGRQENQLRVGGEGGGEGGGQWGGAPGVGAVSEGGGR